MYILESKEPNRLSFIFVAFFSQVIGVCQLTYTMYIICREVEKFQNLFFIFKFCLSTHRSSIEPMSGEESGVNIPKFISSTPWYQGGGNSDVKQAPGKNSNPLEESEPVAGDGVVDSFKKIDGVEIRQDENWDAKRDRWHGYEGAEWEKLAGEWSSLKGNKKIKESTGAEDKYQYDLELLELGLTRKDMVSSAVKEDSYEKVLRDRKDVPEYLKKITTSSEGKVRATNLSKDEEFISEKELRRDRQEKDQIKQLETFAWEKSKIAEKTKDREMLQKRIRGEFESDQDYEVDLLLNLHANPTAIYLQNKQEQMKKKEISNEKKRKLADRYG